MHKNGKNGNIVFYQKKEYRKITIFEIAMLMFSLYILYHMFVSGVNGKNTILIVIITAFIISKYISPVFLKKYNATITDDRLILENINLTPIIIDILSIVDFKRIDKNTINITGNIKNKDFNYRITLDEDDVLTFMNTIKIKIEDNKNKIRNRLYESLNQKVQ